jgi:hypothetical protein
MNINIRFALILVLGLCVCGHLTAQKPADMAGTWSGPASLDGMEGLNEFVLVMELEGGKLKGHLTDEYGTVSETPIKEIKLEGAVFSFSVVGMGPGGEELTLVLKMTVEGDSMKGTLEIPDMGMTGAWEASKK